MTCIRQMAQPLYIINFSKLRFRLTNLISAKNCVDRSSISEVRGLITTEWPRFYGTISYIKYRSLV